MALELVVQESYRWVLVAVFFNIIIVFGMAIMVSFPPPSISHCNGLNGFCKLRTSSQFDLADLE